MLVHAFPVVCHLIAWRERLARRTTAAGSRQQRRAISADTPGRGQHGWMVACMMEFRQVLPLAICVRTSWSVLRVQALCTLASSACPCRSDTSCRQESGMTKKIK